jgi:hypothetical protein
MNPVHYAAVMFAGRWKLIGKGLRWGDYATREEAVAVARRMAHESEGLGIEIHLHVHEDTGVLRQLDQSGDTTEQATASRPEPPPKGRP